MGGADRDIDSDGDSDTDADAEKDHKISASGAPLCGAGQSHAFQAWSIIVKRIAVVQDMGQVINPEGGRLQREGCVVMGLSSVLIEEIRFRGGEVKDRNFDTYEITRFSWVPEIETGLVENPALAPEGGGEPAVTCMAALMANAVFDATGIRFR
jgi:CO/xanthine dehydrogenase Mo-binding subunit